MLGLTSAVTEGTSYSKKCAPDGFNFRPSTLLLDPTKTQCTTEPKIKVKSLINFLGNTWTGQFLLSRTDTSILDTCTHAFTKLAPGVVPALILCSTTSLRTKISIKTFHPLLWLEGLSK